MNFQVIASERHDAKVKIKGSTVECHSPGYLKRAYPRGGCKVIGEMSGGSKKDAIGTVQLGRSVHDVLAVGQHSGLMWKTAGYVQVGPDEYVALLQSRLKGRTPDRDEGRKLSAMLSRRGFTWQEIRPVLSRFLDGEDLPEE